MRIVVKKKRRSKLVLKLALLSFVLYVIALLVSQQMMVQDKKNKLDALNQKLTIQKMKNEEIKKSLDSENENNLQSIEKSAREDLQLAKQGERIFINAIGE